MPMFYTNGRVADLYYQGSKVKEAYYEGHLVYSSLTPLKGFEAVFDQMDIKNWSVFLDTPPSHSGTVTINSSYRNTSTHVLCGDDSSFTITQRSNNRAVVDVRISGGTISTKSTGDRGNNKLSYSGKWPGGVHLVTVSTESDWYGYRMKTLVDGVEVATQTNGGAFTLSEEVLVKGEYDYRLTNCFARSSVILGSALGNAATKVQWIVDALEPGAVNWRVLSGPISGMAVPGGETVAWLYSGGSGGQGGTTSSAGRAGAAGPGRYVGSVTPSNLSTLVVGSGGAGGSPGSIFAGEYGDPGGDTVMRVANGSSQSSDATGRPRPSVWDSTYSGNLPGLGGAGGAASPSSTGGESYQLIGRPGSRGGNGGAIVARHWP